MDNSMFSHQTYIIFVWKRKHYPAVGI